MKDTIYLIVNKKKVERMTKTLPDARRGEIIVKAMIEVKDSCFGQATIPQEIYIDDWRDGIDLEDVEFRKNFITKEESDLIKKKRLDKMTEILQAQGYDITKPDDNEEGGQNK